MSILFITHNLGVVAEIAHDVVVMYGGRVVEQAPVQRSVRASAPSLHARGCSPARRTPRATSAPAASGRRSIPIPGSVPPITALPPGCAFEPRCEFALEACRAAPPPLVPLGQRAFRRCIRSAEL